MSIRLSRIYQIRGLKNAPKHTTLLESQKKVLSIQTVENYVYKSSYSLECFYFFFIVLLILYYNVHPRKEANLIMHLQVRKEKTIFCQNIYNNSFKRNTTFKIINLIV